MSFIDFRIGRRHVYINILMPGLYYYWWRITSFGSSIGNKETRIIYVANVITFSVFSELLWKFTLLVSYKLNRFRPPRLNQFDIRALLYGGWPRFITLDKMVFYGYWKTLPSGSFPMLHISLTLFPLCNGLCCSLSDYYINYYNSVIPYVCFYFCFSVWNYIISLAHNYWRKHLTKMSCDVSS